jgi:hypothetical protein
VNDVIFIMLTKLIKSMDMNLTKKNGFIRMYAIWMMCSFLTVFQGFAQTKTVTGAVAEKQADDGKITGIVVDDTGEPLPGVVIRIVGNSKGWVTDTEGSFTLESISIGTKLEISYIGLETKIIEYKGERNLSIVLQPKVNELDEVTIVAFGKQKKESVISAIQTVNVKELRAPSSNLTTSFAGRIAGMISYQTSGEPGYDNADFLPRRI